MSPARKRASTTSAANETAAHTSAAKKTTAARKSAAKKATATKPAVKKTTTRKVAANKTTAKKAATTKSLPTSSPAAAKPTAAKGSAAKRPATKGTGTGQPSARTVASKVTNEQRRSNASPTPRKGSTKQGSGRHFAGIREAMVLRRGELRAEYDGAIAELNDLQRDRVRDTAGDDQADAGTKTFEREQEISLANSILDRLGQVERALERIDDGSYGYCERCGRPIPKARLEAFPSVTLCVACKQHEERR